MRPCDLNRVTITREERHNYQLCFPGLPIWICVALEKLSSELVKVCVWEREFFSSIYISVNL